MALVRVGPYFSCSGVFLGFTCPAVALVSYWVIFIHDICILFMSINAILDLTD